MVFNGDSGNLDICTLADKMLGDCDDTEFPLAEKALYANMTMRIIFRAIYEVYGGWVFQDSNVSGLDSVATNLLNNGTQFYAFATAQWINGVEYMDEDGNKFPLKPITLEQIRERGYSEDEFFDTPSTPQYYRPVKNGIKIYPAWDTNKAQVDNGLIVKIGAQDIAPFSASSTSTEPGYDSLAGHEAVAAGMSMYFADFNELSAFSKRKLAFEEALSGIKNHYKKKFREMKPAIRKGPMGGGYASQMI